MFVSPKFPLVIIDGSLGTLPESDCGWLPLRQQLVSKCAEDMSGAGSIFISLALLALGWICCASASANLTEFLSHRQRRGLIFQNSGSIKFSIGPSLPIPLGDHVSFRSAVLSFTLQTSSNLPTTPIWPWDKWESTFARSLQQMRRNIERNTANGVVRYADDARLLTYTVLEEYMGRRNNNMIVGRQCLLRSICENAQVHHHVGIFSEILNIVLRWVNNLNAFQPFIWLL